MSTILTHNLGYPRIGEKRELKRATEAYLMEKAEKVLPRERLWVNPDCGLKTRRWEEVKLALANMTQAAEALRKQTA